MKDKTIKIIRICCYVALIFCTVWLVFTIVHSVQLLNGKDGIDWKSNGTMKVVFSIFYILSTITMLGLWFKVIVNILTGLRESTVFPKSNIKLLFWLSFVYFVYLLCWTNQFILYKDDVLLQLQMNNIVTPFFLLFFAFMYKVAADAVEENNLTI